MSKRPAEKQEKPASSETGDSKSLYRLTLVPDDGEEAYLELPSDKAALEEARRAVRDNVFESSDEKATLGRKVQVTRPDGSVVGITTVKE